MSESAASATVLQQLNMFTHSPKSYRHWISPVALKPHRVYFVQRKSDATSETPYNEHKEGEHVRHQIVVNDDRPALNASRSNEVDRTKSN